MLPRNFLDLFHRKIQVEVRKMLAPWLYRYRRRNMTTSQIFTLLSLLKKTFSVNGNILEIGCYRCQTSYLLFSFLKENGISKEYYALDRFSGFRKTDIEKDINKYSKKLTQCKNAFSYNSFQLTKKILRLNNMDELYLISGDICEMDLSFWVGELSFVLIDVDVEIPVLVALRKAYPLLSKGGIICVDDYKTAWKGVTNAVDRFSKYKQLEFLYENHIAIFRK